MAITHEDLKRLEMTPTRTMRRTVAVLGAGGVGSNLLRTFMEHYKDYIVDIYDFDKLEIHNLNRSSLFSLNEVRFSLPKTEVLKRMSRTFKRGAFVENNENYKTSIPRNAYNVRVEPTTELGNNGRTLVIDSRDTMDMSQMHPQSWIKLAYDGGSNIGFTFLPYVVAGKVFDLSGGRNNSYEITPSFYVPAAILSVMTLRFMEFTNFSEITKHRAGTVSFNIDELMDNTSFIIEGEYDNE